jgi:hypothetical protein
MMTSRFGMIDFALLVFECLIVLFNPPNFNLNLFAFVSYDDYGRFCLRFSGTKSSY